MPLDCSDCVLKNQVPGVVLPCQRATAVFKTPISDEAAATKQVPLLHLLNELMVAAYDPQARKVRATWTALKYSEKTRKPLAQRLVEVNKEKAQTEAREMLGMLFAQQPHLMSLLAQFDGPRQRAAATAIAKLLKGHPAEDAIPSKFELDLFRGTTHVTLERSLHDQLLELEKKQAELLQQLATREHEFLVLEHRQEAVGNAIGELQGAVEKLEMDKRVRDILAQDSAQYLEQCRKKLVSLLDENGHPFGGTVLEFILDSETDTPDERAHRQQALNLYVKETGQFFDKLHQNQQKDYETARAIEALREKINQLQADLAQSETLYDVYDRLLLEYELLRIEERHLNESMQETRRLGPEERALVQNEALANDFGLNPDNYANPQDFDELQAILEASPVARQMYLTMHPSLKYTNDATQRCKIHKLLSSPEMLDAMAQLDKANLAHPGPNAKLGVFVNNALVPGSYDDRHREMVQSELGEIQHAMIEHGMDPTVFCHSCGSGEPSGRSAPELAQSWIRDHNPPTSLFNLGSEIYSKHLGLQDYGGGQILLPQCRECSKRQGALTSKVVKLINQLDPKKLQDPNFDMRAWLRGQFIAADSNGGADEWNDFVRVALMPCNGWRNPVDHSQALQNVNWNALVTTGGPGSFSGIDADLLMQLGNSAGCHTCVDVDRQTDPFRNILWIADHQPPTSLVARGLAELPQIVYPHCWKCSETQAQLARKVGSLFDQCFTKEFSTNFTAQIRTQAWTND